MKTPDSRRQLWVMIRYELVMGWRRGPARIVLVAIGLMPIIGFFVFTEQALQNANNIEQLTAESLSWYRTALTISDQFLLIPIMVFLLPLLVADAIPLDRHYRVREIISALPLPPGGYLAGKMLPVWLGITLVAAFAAVADMTLSFFYRGPFMPGPVIGLWLAGIWPHMLFSSQMGVMLASGQKSRRGAVVMGGLATLASMAGLLVLPITDIMWAGFIQGAFIPTNPMIGVSRYPPYPDVLSLPFLARIGLILAVMVGVWLFTARRLEREET